MLPYFSDILFVNNEYTLWSLEKQEGNEKKEIKLSVTSPTFSEKKKETFEFILESSKEFAFLISFPLETYLSSSEIEYK